MDRRIRDVLRAGATAVGVATGLMALASTAQTPDGYIHASFGGPLDVFGNTAPSADVMSIGDGTNDSSELASLLKGPLGPDAKDGAPDSPIRVAYEAGSAPNTGTGEVTDLSTSPLAANAPNTKDVAILPPKPVVDAHGRVDCSGAVSCHTDPATNTTTVTYPDGLVAIVQKINDLTVVAYKTITDVLPSDISSILPTAPTTPPLLAAVAPTPVAPAPMPTPDPALPSVAPSSAPPVPETAAPSAAPSPPPGIDLDPTNDARRGPRINVTTPPRDFTPGKGFGSTPGNPGGIGSKVKDTIGGVVDAVTGAVGKALNPGAASKPATTSDSTPKSGSATNDGGTDKGGSDGS